MSVSAKYVNRKLLQNVLHHVDTHNRLLEEKDMWNSKRNQREGSNASDYDQRMGSSERRRSYGRMRSDDNETKSTTRDIVKLKEEMGKWNHTGFMELYPDEFLSRQSMDELSNGEEEGGGGIKKKVKKKRRKRKNSDSNGLDRRKRKRTSEKTLNKDLAKKPRRSDPSGQWQEREITREVVVEKPHKRRKSEDRTKRKKEKRKDNSKRKDKSKKHKKRRKKMKPDVEK
ncbi:hypothetical protein BSL78_09676 [Apostichopus japonicus]|uniref:Uncharacterized protein n=1 Tax=Stichopus japonicus TaxID=307972 RepID=A0A2G8KZK4_STIJA|nr:hypothetical protein BSL78_09676 [Apostichopus japonicus]